MVLTVGIPKEIKIGERRVGLTPNGVQILSQKKIPVYVEKSAGLLSRFSDREYEQAGAHLVSDKEELWGNAVLIKKVKEPITEEFDLFKSRHIIFTYLHLASPSERSLLEALLHSKATAIGYETIERKGETPLLKPMCEVAGVLAAYFAGVFHNHVTVQGTKISGIDVAKIMMEKLASRYPEIPKNLPLENVMILGGGHVGTKAAWVSCNMNGCIFLSEISGERRKHLKEEFTAAGLKINLINPHDKTNYEETLASCDVIIAAVHSAGKRAPIVIDAPLLKKMSEQKKKIILDIAIDQGGNVAESRPADYEELLYIDSFRNLRFSVTNIPSLCGRGASIALEAVSLEYTAQLAQGLDHALRVYPELKTGINVLNGEVVHPAVLEAHGLFRRKNVPE